MERATGGAWPAVAGQGISRCALTLAIAELPVEGNGVSAAHGIGALDRKPTAMVGALFMCCRRRRRSLAKRG